MPDELDERGVGPLQVLEEERDRPLLGHALEEETPGAEELLLAPRRPLLEPEQVQQSRLDEPALLVVGQELLDGRSDLPRGGRRLLTLGDAGAHAHHLGERPEGDALPVGEAAPAVPPDVFLDTVHVLEVLPAEPRLADAGDADDGHELRPALVGRGVEDLLHEPKLAVAPDERRLQADRLEGAAAAGGHAKGAPERDRLRLPLELVLARAGVGDGRLRRALGRLPDEDRARLGRRLHARGGVDEVARDHPLPLGADRHSGLTGEDAGADLQGGIELGNGRDEVERCANGPLGVVLLRDRRSPDRHHRVADELLDRSAVALDERPRLLEVAGEELARLLRVPTLRGRGEADEVGEEHGDEPPLRGRCRCGPLFLPGRLRGKCLPALAAELDRRAHCAFRTKGRRRASVAPHSPQNLWPAGFSSARRAGHAVAGTRAVTPSASSRSSHSVAPICSKSPRASSSSGRASSARSVPSSQRP